MLSYRGGRRVAVVARPVDRVLDLMRLGLIPLVILVASVPTLRAVAGLGALSNGWPLAFAAIAVVLVYALLLQAPSVSSRVDRIFDRLRRRVTMACQPKAPSSHRDPQVACLLTPEALRAPLLPYDQQRRVVKDLVEACRLEQMGQFWFLEGGSGRGKTRTSLLLVQELVRDLSLLRFGTHSYFYDFGDPDSEQDAFLRSLGGSRHEQAVVVVDNFQQVRADVLRDLTRRLIYEPSSQSERLLLFLTRPPDAWNISPGAEVRLVSEAKAANRHLALSGPPSESLTRSLSELDQAGSQLVQELQDDHVASAPQLHLAQVIARHRSMPPEVSTILGLLEGDTADSTADGLAPVLALIAALAMHSGSFSARAFRRAARTTGDGGSRLSATVQIARTRAKMRRLRRIGLVTRSNRRGTRYAFHEASAKLCIDRLSTLPAFRAPFSAVGRSRLHDVESAGDPLRAWLIAVEVGAQEAAAANFDAAVAGGPYTRMLRCLRRASARYPLSGPLRLQLAILLDRTGDFSASRQEFSDELMQTLDPSSELSIIFVATRLEASHDHDSTAGLELLCNHPDRLVEIIGEYWKVHLAAHHGTFQSQKLLDLATEALDQLESRESHWLNYSLGRMHFDSLRHHYLEGGTPVDAVASPQRRALGRYLRTRLTTYDAFETLYTRAHLVGHVLLPQVALFFEPVTAEQAALADVEPRDVATIDDLVKTTQRLYRHAREQFSQYGDREALYLQADVLNAEMIDRECDLDTLTVGLHEYERFIADTGFPDIASYPHLFFLRWNILKYYRVIAESGSSAPRAAQEHLASARRHLQQIVALDTKAGNEYGLMRAKLLGVLLRWVEKPPRVNELKSLSAQMAERGYAREERLLDHLAEREPLPILELRDIFRFYPFVGQ